MRINKKWLIAIVLFVIVLLAVVMVLSAHLKELPTEPGVTVEVPIVTETDSVETGINLEKPTSNEVNKNNLTLKTTEEIYEEYFKNNDPTYYRQEDVFKETQKIVSLLYSGETLSQEQKDELKKSRVLFENYELEDAIHLGFYFGQWYRWCLANTFIQETTLNVVDECMEEGGIDKNAKDYPEDFSWLERYGAHTEQVATFYVAGTQHYILGDDVDKTKYYLNKVIEHYDDFIERHGLPDEEYSGTYIDMVNDSKRILEIYK